METNSNIQLRSERMRHVIGRVPPLLVNVGTGAITLIMALLFVAVCYVHYPVTVEAEGQVIRTGSSADSAQALLYVPYKYKQLFNHPHKAMVTVEGYSDTPIVSHVSGMSPVPVKRAVGNCFAVTVPLPATLNRQPIYRGLTATASFQLSNYTLLQLLFPTLSSAD